MRYYIYTAAALAAAIPSFAQAQTTIGEASIGYYRLTEGDLDTSGIRLDGSAEYIINREFSVQGDLAYKDFEIFDASTDAFSYAGHAIYHANDNASFGFYLGRQNFEDLDVTFYGAEAGYGLNGFEVAGYIGVSRIDDDVFTDLFDDLDLTGIDLDLDVTQLGLELSYALANDFTVSGSYDNSRFSDIVTVNRFGLGAEFDATESVTIGAEIGHISVDLVGAEEISEAYAQVTASIAFGGSRGATFDQRDFLSNAFGF